MPPPRPARILIVDDSAVMRSLLRSVVATDARLYVAGTASDGASALRAMDSLNPDLVLLDVEMPVMDGLNTLKQMKAKGRREPVIMCSSLTQRGAKVTIEALASGAADYVTKPAGQASREAAVLSLAHDLIPKIMALTGSHNMDSAPAHVGVFSMVASPASAGVLARSGLPDFRAPGVFAAPPQAIVSTPGVLLIGVSTGGPAALDVVLPALPAGFPLPVLVVQHMPELFTKMLAERLDTRCPLRVVEAVSGQLVHPGVIYIAKGNWHMEVSATGPASPAHSAAALPAAILRLTQAPPENHCRPAVDVLFRSAVAVYSSRVLAVVLTGMGYDGLLGCRLIREHQGTIMAQDQPTSAVWGMPGAVSQAGLAHRILPLNAIAPEILRLEQF
jgi:two-component system chemotaxis response regulator CheB